MASSAAPSAWRGQVRWASSTGAGESGDAGPAPRGASRGPAVPLPREGLPASALLVKAVPGSPWQQRDRFALTRSQRPHRSARQNLPEPEFLSSHGSRVRKQVNGQTAVNTGTERNLCSPAPRARGDIQMPRPLRTPFLSRFLVINSLLRRRGQWDVGSHGGQRATWQP